jgi:serine phosphatase RsbU (regulator of sigma subunit)/anti-sigma regulatory factor (Ser/Thr protein kinase)
VDVAERLSLADGADAVPQARRFTVSVLSDLGRLELVAEAELVVSELVTNALLHGKPPVVVRVTAHGSGVRIEVADGSRSTPVRADPGSDAMTGRGIGLVESVSARWGVAPSPGGKSVWCELEPSSTDRLAPNGADPSVAAALGVGDAMVPAWDQAAETIDRDDVFTVSLGDVPTDLLLATKAHVDNLVREFTLAASGAESGSTAALPAHLTSLIETVVHGFADARHAIRVQALAAAEAGAARTHLSLTLPVSAARAGDAYLAALDEVDKYARAARLLTLETPPQHRAFRRWYVQSLITQLRALAAGRTPPVPESFEQRLLAELQTVTVARQMADRAARLQTVTSGLSGATTIDEVTSVVVREGLDALGATSGLVLLRAEQNRVAVSSAVGYADRVLDAMRAESVDTNLPGAAVLRGGEPVWLESRQEIADMFPGLGEFEPRTQSLCAVPAAMAGTVLGALRFSFNSPRLFDVDERRFVLALAAQAAQALERGALYTAERNARAAAESLTSRLRRLQQITAELAATNEAARIAEIVVVHASDALAATGGSLCLLEGSETLRIAAIRGVPDELVQRYRTFSLHADLPASEATRTNSPVIVGSREELLQRYPALLSARPRDGSLICVPLHTGERRLGAISLQFPPNHEVTDPDELAFLISLADASAQAIDRCRAETAARVASDKLTFLADASAELAASLDFRATLGNVARLVVPRLADWCSIQIVHDGQLETVVVAHIDPDKVAFAEEIVRRYPTNPDSTVGVPNVIRTGRSELYPRVSDDMLAAGAIDEEHLRVTRGLGVSSVLIVPLTGSSGTFGALTLVYAESGRHFGEADLAFTEELARRAAVAVENASEFQQQSGRLAAITRIAEAAQHAILAPVPRRAGPVALAGAYVSAAREALVGGDLYEVITCPQSVRLIIGDVRGKGLDAVRLTTVVLGYFRAAAGDKGTLADAARQIDTRLTPHLGDEDFVTAMLVEIHDDGHTQILSCGHPGPLLADADGVTELICPPSLPLGLGSNPEPLQLALKPGNRLLLYTDGLIEARTADGEFADLSRIIAPLRTAELNGVLDQVLARLRASIGGDLDDDLALLVAEYQSSRSTDCPDQRTAHVSGADLVMARSPAGVAAESSSQIHRRDFVDGLAGAAEGLVDVAVLAEVARRAADLRGRSLVGSCWTDG